VSSRQVKKPKTWGLKIISVFLAVMLWFYVVNQNQSTVRQNSVEVQLQYYHLAEGLNVTGPETVYVTQWGAFKDAKQIEAYVDLAGLGTGSFELPVKISPIRGALLTSVEPDKVKITLQEVRKKELDVELTIADQLPEGYQLQDLLCDPSTCVIKGEEKDLNKVVRVVGSVSLQNTREYDVFNIPLVPVDNSGRKVNGIRVIPESTVVYAVANKERELKNLEIIPRFSGQLNDGYVLTEVTVRPREATVLGTEEQLKKMDKVLTEEISLNGKDLSFTGEIGIVVDGDFEVFPDKVFYSIETRKEENSVITDDQ